MFFLKFILISYCLKVLVYFIFLLKIRVNNKPLSTLPAADLPSVDIVLPMYNEEGVIVKTISNLLAITYHKFSIIVVDDGSTDESYTIVTRHFSDHPRIKIIHQPNSGKSTALNRAMIASQSDIIICIDADTLVKPDGYRYHTALFPG